MLFNIVKGCWDEELLKLLNIPASMMPEVVSSSGRVGEVTTTLGLQSVPIQALPAISRRRSSANCACTPETPRIPTAPAAFCCSISASKFVSSEKQLITTLACSLDNKLQYALEGSIFIGGAVVQWLRDNLKLIHASADVEALAKSVKDADGVVFVPAFVGLGAPHWDPYASGLIIGLTRSTQPGHIARAAMESMLFRLPMFWKQWRRIRERRSASCAWMAEPQPTT